MRSETDSVTTGTGERRIRRSNGDNRGCTSNNLCPVGMKFSKQRKFGHGSLAVVEAGGYKIVIIKKRKRKEKKK